MERLDLHRPEHASMNSAESLADDVFSLATQAFKETATTTNNSELDEKICEVYTKVGTMLSRYRSGKVPKALKILPKLKNWQEIMYLTKPEQWTAHATYQVTKIFISGLSSQMVGVFLSDILLPKIREEVKSNKKISSHLYEALKKSVYKPEAFFKGIVLKISEDPDATLKEAMIIASILAKLSIPMLHSAAMLLRLADGPYSGPKYVILKAILDKRYSLPLRVTNALITHFCTFEACLEKLPVIWHQCLLIFVQRYKNDLQNADRSRLRALLEKHFHTEITLEIVKELEG